MPLPTKPPDSGNIFTTLIMLLMYYINVVQRYAPLLFASRESVTINHYCQILENKLPAEIMSCTDEVLPMLRALVAQSMPDADGHPATTEHLLLLEHNACSFARWQAAWALGWCVLLPGAYLLWQLWKLIANLHALSAVIYISDMAFILLLTVIIALASLLVWNQLRTPFARWCKHRYAKPDLHNFQEDVP